MKDFCKADYRNCCRGRQSPVLQLTNVRKIDPSLMGKLALAEAGSPPLLSQEFAECSHNIDKLLNVEWFVNSTANKFTNINGRGL